MSSQQLGSMRCKSLNLDIPKILEGIIVYVIDDDAAIRESIGVVLEANGATVMLLRGVGETRGIPIDNQHGCLLIDMNLLDGLGPSLLMELRAEGISAPAILMTGMIEPRHREIAKFLQVAIMEKPVDGDDVAIKLAALMAREP